MNSQNFMKIVNATFYKIEILIFFLNELPMILKVGPKRKKKKKCLEIFARKL